MLARLPKGTALQSAHRCSLGLPALYCLLCGILGVLASLEFCTPSPWSALWPLLAVTAIMHMPPMGQTRGFLPGFLFGLPYFGLGNNWLYTMLVQYGHAPAVLSALLSFLCAVCLAASSGLATYCYRAVFPRRQFAAFTWGMPACWVLLELLRGQFLWIGIPCLLVSYPLVDYDWSRSWLQAWAPLLTVYGADYLALSVCGAACAAFCYPRQYALPAFCWISILYGATGYLAPYQWTHPSPPEATQRATLIQGNIPQDTKFLQTAMSDILQHYWHATQNAQGSDWIIWPETAIPFPLENLPNYIHTLDQWGQYNRAAVVIGGYRIDSENQVYNTAKGLGLARDHYDKYQLMPIGEYPPFKGVLATIEAFLGQFIRIPFNALTPGPWEPQAIHSHGIALQPFICFEVLYADTIAKRSRHAHGLINISNDTWFGQSNGHAHHLQVTRIRAIETQRPILRATNDGLTAIIDSDGQITARAPAYVATTTSGTFLPRTGTTPVQHTGSIIVWLLCAAPIGTVIFMRWRKGKQGK